VKPEVNLDHTRTHQSTTGEVGTISGIGASTASIALGTKYGGLVVLFDMLKAMLPILALQIIFPGQSYGLVFSIFAILGHNYPIYYGFSGGRGLSPMLGSLLVIEPIGMVAALFVSTIVSMLINQPPTSLILWFPMLTIWALFVRGDISLAIYSVLLILLFLIAEIPEMKLAMQYRKQGRMDEYNEMILESAPQMRMMKRLTERFRFWDNQKKSNDE
jgi:glycerol-3-phosphate acyltransferase PlsY